MLKNSLVPKTYTGNLIKVKKCQSNWNQWWTVQTKPLKKRD